MFASNKPQLQYKHNINVLFIYKKKIIYYIIYIFNDLVRRISLIVSRTFIGSASRSPLSVENKFPSRACLRMRAYFYSFHVKFYQMPVTFLSTVCFFICIIQTLTARQLFLYWVGTYLVRCQGYCQTNASCVYASDWLPSKLNGLLSTGLILQTRVWKGMLGDINQSCKKYTGGLNIC